MRRYLIPLLALAFFASCSALGVGTGGTEVDPITGEIVPTTVGGGIIDSLGLLARTLLTGANPYVAAAVALGGAAAKGAISKKTPPPPPPPA